MLPVERIIFLWISEECFRLKKVGRQWAYRCSCTVAEGLTQNIDVL